MIGIIAAVSTNGVIGKNNSIPWSYPEDTKFFRLNTKDSVVIMGKNTFYSMGSKPLPRRRNMIVSQSMSDGYHYLPGAELYPSLTKAIEEAQLDDETHIWLIGGSKIYEEGFKYANVILITEIPHIIEGDDLTYFPKIDENKFVLEGRFPLSDQKSAIKVAKYIKK